MRLVGWLALLLLLFPRQPSLAQQVLTSEADVEDFLRRGGKARIVLEVTQLERGPGKVTILPGEESKRPRTVTDDEFLLGFLAWQAHAGLLPVAASDVNTLLLWLRDFREGEPLTFTLAESSGETIGGAMVYRGQSFLLANPDFMLDSIKRFTFERSLKQRQEEDEVGQCRHNLYRLAKALELYRHAQGDYPQEFSALAPKYLEDLPLCPSVLKMTYRRDEHRIYCQSSAHQPVEKKI